MYVRAAIPLMIMLMVYADVPRLSPARTAALPSTDSFPSDQRIPLYPALAGPGEEQGGGGAPAPASGAKRSTTLQERSKLDLIRYVSGEFAKAKKPIPGGKDGITMYADKPLDEEVLHHAVVLRGAAVNTGDKAQITKLEFHD